MKYLEVFVTALKLGLISFGGPVAHLSYFYDEYVKRKKWISDQAYADLVALCQFLPGPASSQVGMGIGLSRAGILGAILAWVGFTLPSAILLVLMGTGLAHVSIEKHQNWIHGLKVVAVAVVAQAVLGMAKRLCPDKSRVTIAVVSSAAVLISNSVVLQVLVLLLAGVVGAYFLKSSADLPSEPLHKEGRAAGVLFLSTFFILLIFLPLLRSIYSAQVLKLFDSFFRAGSLVFGGGHVVLPLLRVEVVPTGWVTNDLFMAGYGLANAIPGPLFTFSAYLGAVSSLSPNGWVGAIICLFAAFLPSFLLIVGVLPFWEKLRCLPKIHQSMMGVNAAVVGILLAAFYNPVWMHAVFSVTDLALVVCGFLLLEIWKMPSWAVVLGTVVVSGLL